jgi:hypothetical protein
MEQVHAIVDATIRKYLTDKVREKFPEDFHLIEPMMEKLTQRYSLKELFMICAVEINRAKQSTGASDAQETRRPGRPRAA